MGRVEKSGAQRGGLQISKGRVGLSKEGGKPQGFEKRKRMTGSRGEVGGMQQAQKPEAS